MRALVFTAFLGLLPACAVSPAAPAAQQIDLGGGFTVFPTGDWTHIPDGHDGPVTRGSWLTQFGTELDYIWMITDLAPGERAVEAGIDTYDGPEWQADASPSEFARDTLAALGYYDIALSPTTQRDLAGAPGQFMGWAATSHLGATYLGSAYWSRSGDRLTLIVTMGTEDVYSERVWRDQSATVDTLTRP